MSLLGYYVEKPKVTRFPTFQSQSTGPRSPRTPPPTTNVRWSSTSNERAAPSESDLHDDTPDYHERAQIAPDTDAFVSPKNFDEYGGELDADARVWKTYVKESDEFDMDLVDGWNRQHLHACRSLDVILIFAALFSAISTTFVLESSKLLQEDPADATSQTLETISQTLLLIARGNESLVPRSAGLDALGVEDEEFVPDPVANGVTCLCPDVLDNRVYKQEDDNSAGTQW
ncbi:unnamed protein product [Rhizoctonia solani]|uniref:DUF6535 domain-containing protein n=1 Tax=Rhizoctonia solani TaxID=456999 RepID=A0A8H2WLI3_9AGAM|nr:unnamed protein product [Rhizoctonia solani]